MCNLGELSVFVEDFITGDLERLFFRASDYGDRWMTGNVSLADIHRNRTTIRLKFKSKSGPLGSEVAIDEIEIHEEPCDTSCKYVCCK